MIHSLKFAAISRYLTLLASINHHISITIQHHNDGLFHGKSQSKMDDDWDNPISGLHIPTESIIPFETVA